MKSNISITDYGFNDILPELIKGELSVKIRNFDRYQNLEKLHGDFYKSFTE